MYQNVAEWMDGSGPLSDIVISSRVRLARNVSGFVFFGQADRKQQEELLEYVRRKVMTTELKDDLMFFGMQETSPLERLVLAERHLISNRLAQGQGPCGVAVSRDESLTMMINEEDHLRVQALASGQQLQETYEQINRVEALLEEQMDYAFSPRYGYLTACPTNVGTGIRVSVMLHLPAIKMVGQIEKVFRAAKDMQLAVRGFYGEGSEPVGDFFQMSNQTTLGKSEPQIINELITHAVEPIVKYERHARERLAKDQLRALDDKIFRAYGTLANARMINSEETMYLLSYIRLGIHLERIKEISLGTVNEIFLLTQPGHLQYHCGKELTPAERDEMRAELIRGKLR